MTFFQLYALGMPVVALVFLAGFAKILVDRDVAAFRRSQAEAVPPQIQEAARAANEKFIADAMKEMANRPAA
jgi:hypothetical protein